MDALIYLFILGIVIFQVLKGASADEAIFGSGGSGEPEAEGGVDQQRPVVRRLSVPRSDVESDGGMFLAYAVMAQDDQADLLNDSHDQASDQHDLDENGLTIRE